MSDETQNAETNEEFNGGFGVTTETKSTNVVLFDKGGIKKVLLKEVVSSEIGKDTKYTALTFKFTDLDGIKNFNHTEFAIDPNSDQNLSNPKFDYKKSMEAMNSRLKHIFTAYANFPSTGLGVGATNFKDFFDKVAASFNNEGKPVFKNDKGLSFPVYLKLVYSKKGELRLPIYPNFIERIHAGSNQEKPITLTIDNRYDIIEQPKTTKGNVMGGGAGDIIIDNNSDVF